MLDVAWAKGKGRVPMSDRKVAHCYLLNTQNGWSYGPVSIKGEPKQYWSPTTNFGMLHAGQAKVIHDYWGVAFLADCPFGGMGWENRPTFLWPSSQKNPDADEHTSPFQERQHISKTCSARWRSWQGTDKAPRNSTFTP